MLTVICELPQIAATHQCKDSIADSPVILITESCEDPKFRSTGNLDFQIFVLAIPER
jgi:hypothetical protein